MTLHVPRLLPAVILLAVAADAAAVDLPRRRSGLWEVTTVVPGSPPSPAAQLCIDETTDDLAKQLGQGAVACSKQEIRADGAAFVVDSVCKLGESTATTTSRVTGSFDTSYQVDIATAYDPPLMGMREGKAKVNAKWTGPCGPAQRPGDMTLPNGMTINIFDAPPGAPKRP
jgi:hypothetical protein